MNPENVTVFILGAGLGTRLRPLTNTVPKVMVEIAPSLPLLEHHILQLRDQGFRRFIINLHYLPEQITKHLKDGSQLGVEIFYSDETQQLMDTGGALKKQEAHLSDPFILIYGDQLHFINLREVLKAHEEKGAYATIVLKRSDHPQNGDLAVIDPATDRIVDWLARPHEVHDLGDTYLLNTGMYIFNKEVLKRIPAGTPIHLDKEILPKAIKENELIYAYPTEEPILDIGTLEKLEKARTWYSEKRSS